MAKSQPSTNVVQLHPKPSPDGISFPISPEYVKDLDKVHSALIAALIASSSPKRRQKMRLALMTRSEHAPDDVNLKFARDLIGRC